MPTVLLAIGAALCVAFYLYISFAAETPRSGTLEWISMEDKPKMTRKILHKLKWTDILWGFLTMVLACGINIALAACVDYHMLSASLASGWFLLSLVPMATAAALIYLAARQLTASPVLSALASLASSCAVSFISVSSGSGGPLLALCSFLLLMLWLGSNSFVSWLCLVLSALCLAGSTYFGTTLFLLVLPWLGTVLLGEILRMKQEDLSPWHLVLSLLTGAVVLWLGVTACSIPAYLSLFRIPLPQAFLDGNFYLLFWMQLLGTLQIPTFSVSMLLFDLPALCLAVSAIVLLSHGVRMRHDATALCLLLWLTVSLAVYLLYTPAAPLYPMVALSMAYMTNRIRIRLNAGVAVIVAIVPILVTFTTTILTLLEV